MQCYPLKVKSKKMHGIRGDRAEGDEEKERKRIELRDL